MLNPSDILSQFRSSNTKIVPPAAPAILKPKSRWSRDSGVDELVYLLDQEQYRGNWLAISDEASLIAAIQREIVRCRESFEYAARNYFWVADKNGREGLFHLWESQELILEELYWLRDHGLPQKLMILKGRQLGCSTLVEALMAWMTMYFSGRNALIITFSDEHAAKLFKIPQFIYDHLPWWMRPMVASREIKDGMVFNNRSHFDRPSNPGLNSEIMAQSATEKCGPGQGQRINGAHVSEYSDWAEAKARGIIEGDLHHALVLSPDTIAVLESTGKNAGKYAHKLWLKNIELGLQAAWWPLFLPSFFEKTRVLPPPNGWKVAPPEKALQDRVRKEWTQCSRCGRYNRAFFRGEPRMGTTCPSCNEGKLAPLVLTDQQQCFFEMERVNAEKDEESLKTYLQELACVPEDAFQAPGISAIPAILVQYASETVAKPIARGFLDEHNLFHGYNETTGRCWLSGCQINHAPDDGYLLIWEWPDSRTNYCLGGDVSEGLGGEFDYSVGAIASIGEMGSGDALCAMYRNNEIDATSLAYEFNKLGRFYNNALAAVEVNKYDACAETMRNFLNYPNLFRMRSSINTRSTTEKWHWHTTPVSKRRLISFVRTWLKARCLEVRSATLVEEMKTFTQEDIDSLGAAPHGFHDDILIAFAIACYAGHVDDFDEQGGIVPIRRSAEQLIAASTWRMSCTRCLHEFGIENPDKAQWCPNCGSVASLVGRRNVSVGMGPTFEQLMNEKKDVFEEEYMKDRENIEEY